MILRRLSQSLKEQNWMAIGIEFVLLVVGVFLGIQVANWNVERETNKKAFEATEKLIADLRAESWRYQFLLEYHRDVHVAAEKTVGALSGKTPLSNEEFLVNAYRASQYKQGASRRSTYDELVSTGSIALIKDKKLRNVSVRAYSISTIEYMVREGIESRYRELFRMSIPNEVQRTLAKECGDLYIAPGDYKNFDHNIDYPCKTGLPADVIDDAANALRSDPQTIRYLRHRIADLDTRLVDLTQNNRDVWEALVEIAKEKP